MVAKILHLIGGGDHLVLRVHRRTGAAEEGFVLESVVWCLQPHTKCAVGPGRRCFALQLLAAGSVVGINARQRPSLHTQGTPDRLHLA